MFEQMVTWTGMLAQDSGGGAAATGMFAGMGLIGIFFCLVWLALAVFWIWMLIDCIQRDFPGNGKVIWLLVIILVPLIGMFLYFFIGRGKGTKGESTAPAQE